MILSRLNERAPILATGADAKEIVTHRLRMRLVCEEHGITPYVCGPLPAGATLENIALGKRFYLSGFEDESLRGLIATQGADGPTCWDYVANSMLGGRDEQEILHTLLNSMVYDGSTSVLSFFARFVLIANGILPALPAGRLCTLYASRFPAQDYSAIMTVSDAQPGHANFAQYAQSVNNGLQRYHQRMQIQDARTASHPNTLLTEAQEYAADSFFVPPPEAGDDPSVNLRAMANALVPILEAHLGNFRRRPFNGSMSGRPRPPGAPAREPSGNHNRCTNCGEAGHYAKVCSKAKAKCTYPMCVARKMDSHLESECWFKHRSKCPANFLPRRDKAVKDYEEKQQQDARAMFGTAYLDAEDVPDDFKDLDDGIGQLCTEFEDLTTCNPAPIFVLELLSSMRVAVLDSLIVMAMQAAHTKGITFALGAAREIVLTELSRYYSSHMLADDDGPAPVAQASTGDVQYLALATMMDAAADHSPTIRVTDTSTLSDTMLAAYKQAYISFATLPNDKVILPRRGEGTYFWQSDETLLPILTMLGLPPRRAISWEEWEETARAGRQNIPLLTICKRQQCLEFDDDDASAPCLLGPNKLFIHQLIHLRRAIR